MALGRGKAWADDEEPFTFWEIRIVPKVFFHLLLPYFVIKILMHCEQSMEYLVHFI